MVIQRELLLKIYISLSATPEVGWKPRTYLDCSVTMVVLPKCWACFAFLLVAERALRIISGGIDTIKLICFYANASS